MARPTITVNQISAAGSSPGQQVANVGGVIAWTNAGAKMNAIASGAFQSVNLTYSVPGDTNGVFYFLGTSYGADSWSNPLTSGQISAVRSTNGSGSVTDIFDRAPNTTFSSGATPTDYIFVDLGANRSLLPNRYTLQNYTQGNREIRNWRLQGATAVSTPYNGSNISAATWVNLDVRDSDTTMVTGVPSGWATYTPNQSNSTPYRFFRIFRNGVDALNGAHLCTAEWELYGTFNYNTDAVVDGRIIQTETATGDRARQTRWTAVGGELSCLLAPTITTTAANGSITLTPNGTGVLNLNRAVIPNFTPASATATGVQGQITRDANFIYICTATNTWKRVAIATW